MSDFTEKTVTDHLIGSPGENPGSSSFGLNRQKLVERYQSLLRSKGVYYPVAYEFLNKLGQGRQGIVFLCRRHGARGCHTRHAVKIYDPGLYSSPERYYTDMGRIASQISSLQGVRSPYLVDRASYDETDGIGYVQMEAVDGVNLHYLMQRRHLAQVKNNSTTAEWDRFTDVIFRLEKDQVSIQPGIVIYIIRHILRALELLHDRGFVHSDIKPANVMIDRLGDARVIDYGRAVRINEKVGILLGTPFYMAPETHLRKPSLAQTDLYSVGLVAIELLSGKPLVKARNEEDLLEFKMTLPDRLHEILPEYVLESSLFMELLQSLINPDPDKRVQSSREAEAGENGLATLHRDLVRMQVDANYGRELENFLSKLLTPRPKQFEM